MIKNCKNGNIQALILCPPQLWNHVYTYLNMNGEYRHYSDPEHLKRRRFERVHTGNQVIKTTFGT